MKAGLGYKDRVGHPRFSCSILSGPMVSVKPTCDGMILRGRFSRDSNGMNTNLVGVVQAQHVKCRDSSTGLFAYTGTTLRQNIHWVLSNARLPCTCILLCVAPSTDANEETRSLRFDASLRYLKMADYHKEMCIAFLEAVASGLCLACRASISADFSRKLC